MKRNRFQRVKAHIKLYTYKKKKASQKMIEGDLDNYINSLKDVFETKKSLKRTLSIN